MASPFIKPENLDEPIWRYQSFAKFVAMLEHGGLYFARAIDLARDDPFEGRLSDVGMSLAGQRFPMIPAMSHLLKVLRLRARLSCWHLNAHESVAMWRGYGKHDGAIAVRSTFRALSDALEGEAVVGIVQYINYATEPLEIGPGLYRLLLSKRTEFSHEREVRAIEMEKEGFTWIIEAMQRENVEPARFTVESGRYIAVNLRHVLKEVVVTPEAGAWFEGLVRDVLGRYGLGEIPVRGSTLMRVPPPSP